MAFAWTHSAELTSYIIHNKLMLQVSAKINKTLVYAEHQEMEIKTISEAVIPKKTKKV